jgi:hypothetical protein
MRTMKPHSHSENPRASGRSNRSPLDLLMAVGIPTAGAIVLGSALAGTVGGVAFGLVWFVFALIGNELLTGLNR